MRRLLFVCLLLAPLAHAFSFRFDPPAPTNTTTTAVTLAGMWPIGCPPGQPKITIGDTRITLDFNETGDICPAVIVPFERTANLGVLKAGVYDLVAIGTTQPFPDATPTLRETIATARLVVRDAATFAITPLAGPTSGGTKLRIVSPAGMNVFPHVFVDGVEVPFTADFPFTVQISTPPHGAGSADILVDGGTDGVRLAKAAFTYFDPSATTPDPFVFTPVLFPVDYNGAGALGAQWRTENVLQLAGENRTMLDVTNSAAGRVINVQRDQQFFANSRIRDLSRSALTTGSEVPIARETDFRASIRLLNVPTGDHLRALVRVWTIGESSQVIISSPQILTIRAMTVPLTPVAGGMSYGTIDFSGFIDPGNAFLDIGVAANNPATRIWGMISVTNNETGQVTIVSPQ